MRDKESGKSKGFAFVEYADQRSTVLAVDNFNGIKVHIYSTNFTFLYVIRFLIGRSE